MATYQNIYKIMTSDAKLIGDFTLYESCKMLASRTDRAEDIVHIKCKGKCVGFWSAWHNTVRPMAGSSDAERKLILDWYN